MLKNDAVTVWILECRAFTIPIGTECPDGFEACIAHSLNGGLPFVRVWKVEHKQVIRCRCRPCGVPARPCKFKKMLRRALAPEHYPIKTLVILEAIEES